MLPDTAAEEPVSRPSALRAGIEPGSALTTPTEEISQDQLWEALGSQPGSPPVEAKQAVGEVSLAELAPSPAAAPSAIPALELPEATPPPPAIEPAGVVEPEPLLPAPEIEVAERPQALSLDELLSLGLTAPPPPEPPPPPVEELVFDLTGEMGAPPLPLVEVGRGEPPAAPIEDFLRPAEPAPLETGSGGIPELELELFPTPVGEEAPDLQEREEPPALDLEALAVVSPLEGESLETGPFPGPSTAQVLSEAAEVLAAPPPVGVETPEPTVELDVSRVDELLGEAEVPSVFDQIEAAPPAALVAPALPVPDEERTTAPDITVMRQEVVQRVADELAQELRTKLLERIERVVWEVVPDLAEILITKEIERIRTLAEGKQPS